MIGDIELLQREPWGGPTNPPEGRGEETPGAGALERPILSWRNEVLRLKAAGGAYPALRQQLHFVARSVIVHNYTQAWFWLPSANLFIPPKYINFTAVLAGSQDAIVQQEDPPGAPGAASTITNGQELILIFSELQLTPSTVAFT